MMTADQYRVNYQAVCDKIARWTGKGTWDIELLTPSGRRKIAQQLIGYGCTDGALLEALSDEVEIKDAK